MAVYKSLAELGYPDYRIGDNGIVLSKKTGSGCTSYNGTVKLRRHGSWRILKPRMTTKNSGGQGYLYLNLCNEDGVKSHFVHQLVLRMFVGPCPPGKEACHYPDRDTTNNSLENLSYGTKQRNMRHKLSHGTDQRGTKNGRAKLTWKKVKKMRKIRKERKWSYNRLGRKFGVSSVTARDAVLKRTWRRKSWL